MRDCQEQSRASVMGSSVWCTWHITKNDAGLRGLGPELGDAGSLTNRTCVGWVRAL